MIADLDLQQMINFVTGANEKDAHLINVNIGRDFQVSQFADLRRFVPGDRCPLCGGETRLDKGIEVGHTFKLGTKYSQPMGATYLDDQGREKEIVMGSYGIGVGRTVAAAIEQYFDDNGIIFPIPIAPFHVLILPVKSDPKTLLDLTQDQLDPIRLHMLQPFKTTFRAPNKVALYLFADGSWVIENFNDQEAAVRFFNLMQIGQQQFAVTLMRFAV